MTRWYIPVAAKRRALALYRVRRRRAARGQTSCDPIAAINAVIRYMERLIAEAAVLGDEEMPKLVDEYRAALGYRKQIKGKSQRWQWIDTVRHIESKGKSADWFLQLTA